MKHGMDIITEKSISYFRTWLCSEEKSVNTVEKYVHDVRALSLWLNGKKLSKENIVEWKASLLERGYQPVTVNSMLASVHAYCRCQEIDIRIRFLKIQRRLFRDENRELTQAEYRRLIETARKKGNERTDLLLETIGSTGIRVSEVRYITVAGAEAGKIQISLKGKIRVIMLPKKLCRKLIDYERRQKIASGELFITRSGKGLSRKQIWADMKGLCKDAGVPASKVFPHNLRHLFARVFYHVTRDIVKLSDVLGHSSVDTTRIYLLSSGTEHARQLDELCMVL